jgi:putative hemolysin
VLFWGEWTLSMIVLRSPEAWAMRMTPVAGIIILVMSPLTAIPLLFSGDLTRTSESSSQPYVTEDDLKTMVDTGQEEGLLELGERRMIHRIFDLGETLAREIMVPRIDVMALDVQTPLGEALDALLRSGYSRVPVFDETVDNVMGLLYAKDLLRVWREGTSLQDLKGLLRPAYFVPEAKKVDELLAEMQSQRIHMAVVVDEYGGVAGLVTLEDIVEEIVGEIVDEFDQAEESPYETLDEGEFIFLGRIDLDDFNEIVASSLPKDEADSLGGYIYSRLGHVPSPGETVEVENLRLTVEQVSGRRIRKVRVQWLPAAAHHQENGQHVDDE